MLESKYQRGKYPRHGPTSLGWLQMSVHRSEWKRERYSVNTYLKIEENCTHEEAEKMDRREKRERTIKEMPFWPLKSWTQKVALERD